MGRTEGQDAVPMTLGQEFHAFGAQLDAEIKGLRYCEAYLYEENMGATAIGTGITATPGYAERCAVHLAEITGKPMVLHPELIAATSSMQGFVMYSSAVKSLAVALTKISSDLIILAMGPRTGIFEINLPALQPGSSIMPGKVNPVMAEMLNMVCFQVMGYNTAINYASQAGQLELNVMMPLIANDLIEMLEILTNSMRVFTTKCVQGITAFPDRCKYYAENSISMVTALNTYIGYDKAAEVAKEAVKTGKTLREVILEKKLIAEGDLDKVFDVMPLTEPGIPGKA